MDNTIMNEALKKWLSGAHEDTLYAPEGYKHHGKKARIPYRHVIDNEAKHMKIHKFDNVKVDKKLYYSVIFLDISVVKSYYDVVYPALKKSLFLRDDEFEFCYDWVLSEAISRIFEEQASRVLDHHRHDVFKCVYDHIGNRIEDHIRSSLIKQNYGFVLGMRVKVMVCGPSLMIARSTNG